MSDLNSKDHGWLYEERNNKLSEDAPGGPYEIGMINEEKWRVNRKPKPKEWVKWRFEGTEAECTAVRDALNRLKTNDQT